MNYRVSGGQRKGDFVFSRRETAARRKGRMASARMASAIRPAQGIEAEIPQARPGRSVTERPGRDEELERIAGPEKSSPASIYWAPHRVIWSKETRSIFRVHILVRSPPQAEMRPNFKIHRFNAVRLLESFQNFNLKKTALALLLGFFVARAAVSQSPDSPPPPVKTVEAAQLETLRYGTENEVAALIQTLKNEKAYYLDDELIVLVQSAKNRTILTGAFSFFGERGKAGLEERAIRAVRERNDEAAETVLAAIDYLGKVEAQDAIDPLKDLIDRDEPRFMGNAIRALGFAGRLHGETADNTAEYLIDFYRNRNPGDDSRREIVSALGELGSGAGVAFLSEIAESGEERLPLRLAALDSLSKIGDGLPAVLTALVSPDPNVRAGAVGALGPFSGPEVDSVILEAFRDSYYRARISAAKAAGERKLIEAIPFLRYRAEKDEVPAVKDEAIRALGALGNPEADAVLSDLFMERKNTDRVRILAADMAARNSAEKYVPPLILEMDEAKTKNQTALYNGFLRTLGAARTNALEALARRFLTSGGVVEKSYALDMIAANEFRSLAPLVTELTGEKTDSLARKARDVLQKLGRD
jgi:HEAT repeat protein